MYAVSNLYFLIIATSAAGDVASPVSPAVKKLMERVESGGVELGSDGVRRRDDDSGAMAEGEGDSEMRDVDQTDRLDMDMEGAMA